MLTKAKLFPLLQDWVCE